MPQVYSFTSCVRSSPERRCRNAERDVAPRELRVEILLHDGAVGRIAGGINAAADDTPGLVWRLQDGDGPGATALRPRGPDFMVNMSVWESLEALRDFVYRNGPHLDFMRRRREWFHRMGEQHLVLWWVPAGHIPDLDEALSRLDLIRSDGPTPLAFTFHEPYPAPAEPAVRRA